MNAAMLMMKALNSVVLKDYIFLPPVFVTGMFLTMKVVGTDHFLAQPTLPLHHHHLKVALQKKPTTTQTTPITITAQTTLNGTTTATPEWSWEVQSTNVNIFDGSEYFDCHTRRIVLSVLASMNLISLQRWEHGLLVKSMPAWSKENFFPAFPKH